MQITNKILSFDTVIFILLFGLLPIDMLNGYLLRDVGIAPPITIAQLYKIILLGFLFIRVNSAEKVIFLSLVGLLLLPTVCQVATSFNIKLVFADAVKVIKYLGSVLAFFYFRTVFTNKGFLLKWVFRWLLFSFMVLVVNISLKFFGLGFPMYTMDTLEIGSKGFFYAGNETSAVLIILSSFLMYWFRCYNKNILFVVFGIVSVLTGLYITSKTAILGTVLSFIFFLLFKPNKKGISVKDVMYYLVLFFVIFPLALYALVSFLKSSDVIGRFSYFWDKLDIYTFILSSRTTFLLDFIEIFKKEYNIIEMIIGVGQSTFETLNNDHIIELDFFDIYFAYGFIGALLFCLYISFLIIKSKMKSRQYKTNIFASYSLYITCLLLVLSFISGHIFNSGMAAIFMGCVFSIMYYKSTFDNTLL